MARRALAWVAAAGLAVGASGCGAADAQRGASAGEGGTPALYTVGRALYGLPGGGRVELAAAPVAPLAGWLSPAAVPSPDGRYVAYNAWRELRNDDPRLSWEDQGIEPGDPLATPSVRICDVETGEDRLLAEGAFSLAWRGDGALAYFRGSERDYRAGVPYAGHVVVRSSLDAAPEQWTVEEGRYVVVGWAGRHLIAYRESEGEALDALALDGPGSVRVLAPRAGVVALSPDGTQAFVEHGPAEGRPAVRVLDVADGHEAARLDLTEVDGAVGAVSYAGDWRENLVVAAAEGGLAVFRVAAGRIALQQVIPLDGDARAAEPRFAAASTERITAWTDARGGAVFLACARAAARCVRSLPEPEAKGVDGWPVWRRPVYNPSRP